MNGTELPEMSIGRPMNKLELLLQLAVAQVFIREATAQNDGEPSRRYMGGRQEAWCAHFIAWLFRMIGLPLPGDVVPAPFRGNPLAGVTHMEEQFKRHGWIVPRDQWPKPGDVVFMSTRAGSDHGPGRHVALAVLITPEYIVTIEGNLGHAVKLNRRDMNDPLIDNIGRVPGLE